MNKKNNGKPFEKLAESIFQKLKKTLNDYSIEHNVYLDSPYGKRQFDVILRSQVAGFDICTAIECKDHNSKVSIKEIDSFESKLKDVDVQKGIMISRKGFSSRAISKAKQVNISLCTAHEALSEDWNIELDIPVYIKQIQPVRFQPAISGFLMNSGDSIATFDKLKINGVILPDCFLENWRNNRLTFNEDKQTEVIELPEVSPPYYMEVMNRAGELLTRKVETVKITVTFEYKYFQMSLNELKGTQVLKDITGGKTRIFLNTESVKFNSEKLKEIRKVDFKNMIGMSLAIFIKPNEVAFHDWKYYIGEDK